VMWQRMASTSQGTVEPERWLGLMNAKYSWLQEEATETGTKRNFVHCTSSLSKFSLRMPEPVLSPWHICFPGFFWGHFQPKLPVRGSPCRKGSGLL
jgi:hypothetical protein